MWQKPDHVSPFNHLYVRHISQTSAAIIIYHCIDVFNKSLTIDVEHHVPHGRTDGLMETEPHLPASTERMVITLRRGEKGTPHWSVSVRTQKK